MAIIIVATVNSQWKTGTHGKFPWGDHPIPADMTRSRRLTHGKTVVMGRKTAESINKPLRGNKQNIVLTRDPIFEMPGFDAVYDINVVRKLAENEDAFILGGAQIYAEFLPFATRMHLTFVDHDSSDTAEDVYFPEYDRCGWVESGLDVVAQSASNPFALTFVEYERISPVA